VCPEQDSNLQKSGTLNQCVYQFRHRDKTKNPSCLDLGSFYKTQTTKILQKNPSLHWQI
jgi:hypothetical protein